MPGVRRRATSTSSAADARSVTSTPANWTATSIADHGRARRHNSPGNGLPGRDDAEEQSWRPRHTSCARAAATRGPQSIAHTRPREHRMVQREAAEEQQVERRWQRCAGVESCGRQRQTATRTTTRSRPARARTRRRRRSRTIALGRRRSEWPRVTGPYYRNTMWPVGVAITGIGVRVTVWRRTRPVLGADLARRRAARAPSRSSTRPQLTCRCRRVRARRGARLGRRALTRPRTRRARTGAPIRGATPRCRASPCSPRAKPCAIPGSTPTRPTSASSSAAAPAASTSRSASTASTYSGELSPRLAVCHPGLDRRHRLERDLHRAGLRGVSHVLSTGCTSSTDAIGYAAALIRHGEAEAVVTGGADACATRGMICGFGRMRVVATRYNERPDRGLAAVRSRSRRIRARRGRVAHDARAARTARARAARASTPPSRATDRRAMRTIACR